MAKELKDRGVEGNASRSSGVGVKCIALGRGDAESWRMNVMGGRADELEARGVVLMGGGTVRARNRFGRGSSVSVSSDGRIGGCVASESWEGEQGWTVDIPVR